VFNYSLVEMKGAT